MSIVNDSVRVGIIGYGRFGEALAGLVQDAGYPIKAWDCFGKVPGDIAATDLGDLLRWSNVIFLAIPVHVFTKFLTEIEPQLGSHQIVVDVCSVKVKPQESLERILAERIPWVATHPLFGPTSLALAERPLRVVVCPNLVHPDAVAQVRRLYETLGCLVLEQDAHSHDRAMAETHAIAFFVAKGILDSAIGLDVPYAPPSFQAIARTVDVVRSDAGHLFLAIQRDNPYATSARKRLLEAMKAVDIAVDEVSQGAEATEVVSPALVIPEGGDAANRLLEARQLIDNVDRNILELLRTRAELARHAGRAKVSAGRQVYDPAREAELMSARRAWAQELDLDPEGVEAIFRMVVRFSRRVQEPSRETS
jgi:prephenate dehydrogenase